MVHRRFMPSAELRSIAPSGFADVRVLVVGDLMLDQYVDGDVHRISPEAPVPVLSVRKRRCVPGGGANVALNVIGLKAQVSVAGVIGTDPAGHLLSDLLTQSGVDIDCVVTVPARPTTSKTRIISGNHQIVRLDEEVSDELEITVQDELVARVARSLDSGKICAVVLSDYGKGVLSGSCPQRLIEACKRRDIPALIDPKRLDYTAYKGCTLVTPNKKEFSSAAAFAGLSGYDFQLAGTLFREQLQCTALLVTQGAEGMTLFTSGQAWHLPAIAEEVFDVSGAGDTVIASIGVALGFGLSFQAAVELANAAASLVVRHAGTTPINWPELRELLGIDLRDTEEQSRAKSISLS